VYLPGNDYASLKHTVFVYYVRGNEYERPGLYGVFTLMLLMADQKELDGTKDRHLTRGMNK
jgi:hypothetical protein